LTATGDERTGKVLGVKSEGDAPLTGLRRIEKITAFSEQPLWNSLSDCGVHREWSTLRRTLHVSGGFWMLLDVWIVSRHFYSKSAELQSMAMLSPESLWWGNLPTLNLHQAR
jgi:hypothetical protein